MGGFPAPRARGSALNYDKRSKAWMPFAIRVALGARHFIGLLADKFQCHHSPTMLSCPPHHGVSDDQQQAAEAPVSLPMRRLPSAWDVRPMTYAGAHHRTKGAELTQGGFSACANSPATG